MSFAAFAHRGGSRVPGAVENTLAAFRQAYDLGYRCFETDVRVSADGVPYAFHDVDLERQLGLTDRFAACPGDDIDELRIDGHPIPRLADLLAAFPDATWNIDVKAWRAIEPTLAVVTAADALSRTTFASFEHRTLRRIRRLNPAAATSASRFEVALVVLLPASVLRLRWRATALQLPYRRGPFTLVTPRLLRRANALGVPVHVWTIDDRAEIGALLDLGVDGLMTDRTDTLRAVLEERGLWV